MKVAAAAALLNHERLNHEIHATQSQSAKEEKHAHPSESTGTNAPLSRANSDKTSGNAVLSAHQLGQNVELLAEAEEEKKRKEYEAEKALVVADPILTTQKTLFESIFVLRECINGADFISPSMMLQYCELQANLPAFLTCLRNEVAYLVRERYRQVAGLESLIVKAQEEEVKQAGKRRLSMFAGGAAKAHAHDHPPAGSASGVGGSGSAAEAIQRNKQLLAIQVCNYFCT